MSILMSILFVCVMVVPFVLSIWVVKKTFSFAKRLGKQFTDAINDIFKKNPNIDKRAKQELTRIANEVKAENRQPKKKSNSIDVTLRKLKDQFDAEIKRVEEDFNNTEKPYFQAKKLLTQYENNKNELVKLIVDNETKCKHLMEMNKVNEARIYAKQRQSAMKRLEELKLEISNLEKTTEAARAMREELLLKLEELKWNKEYALSQLELNLRSEALYQNLSNMKLTDGKDLVKQVKEIIENSRINTDNYRDIYNDTDKRDIETIIEEKEVDDYLNSLTPQVPQTTNVVNLK